MRRGIEELEERGKEKDKGGDTMQDARKGKKRGEEGKRISVITIIESL